MASSVVSARSKREPHPNGWFQRLLRAIRRFDKKQYQRISHTSLQGVPTLLFLIALGMTFFGCLMVLSASSVEMIAQGASPFSQVQRQVSFGAIGIFAMLLIIILPIQLYRNKWFLNFAMLIAVLTQLAVLFVGVEVNGNRNWISLAGLQIQPSELSKVVAILWMAWVLKNQGDISSDYKRAFYPLCLGIFPLIALILFGHDVGTVLVYGAVVFVMIWVSGLSRRASSIMTLVSLLGGAIAMLSSANRRSRVLAVFGICNGSVCDQPNSGLAALASGGFWGVGLGRSRQKYNYLAEAHNDYIFAIIGEELGLIGAFLVLLFYLGIIYCAVRIITRSADRFIQLATTGILTWFVVQALINILMVTGLAPVIGVPLPFISYGGSSLISSLVGAGLLIAFAVQTPLQPITGGTNTVKIQSPRTKDGARRIKLAEIVDRENDAFHKNGWKPQTEFPQIGRLLGFFGLGGHQNQALKETASKHETASREKPQPAVPEPAVRPEPRVRPEEKIDAKVEVSSVSLPENKIEPPQKVPALKLVEEEPHQVSIGQEPTAYKEEETKAAERRLPPGLAPVKQIRAKQRQNQKNS